jgi:hypothetical protein
VTDITARSRRLPGLVIALVICDGIAVVLHPNREEL